MKKRRLATPGERKALAHPLRLRILRLCLDDALTNKELAASLGQDPGTVLFHVRKLLEHDFLVPEPVRSGKGGALEKPYRATGKSWELDMGLSQSAATAQVDALRDELLDAGDRALLTSYRLALRLGEDSLKELEARLSEVIEEFASREESDGKSVGLFLLMHERPDRRLRPSKRRSWAAADGSSS